MKTFLTGICALFMLDVCAAQNPPITYTYFGGGTNTVSIGTNDTNALVYVYGPSSLLWYPLTCVTNSEGVVLSLGQEGVTADNINLGIFGGHEYLTNGHVNAVLYEGTLIARSNSPSISISTTNGVGDLTGFITLKATTNTLTIGAPLRPSQLGDVVAESFIGNGASITNLQTNNIVGWVIPSNGINGLDGTNGLNGTNGLDGVGGSYTNNDGKAGVISGGYVGTNVWGTNVLTTTGSEGQVLTVSNSTARWRNPGVVVNTASETKTIANGVATPFMLISCPTNSRGSVLLDYSIESVSSPVPTTNGAYCDRLVLQTINSGGVITLYVNEMAGVFTTVSVSPGAASYTRAFSTNGTTTNITISVAFSYDANEQLTNHLFRVMNVQNLSTNSVSFVP